MVGFIKFEDLVGALDLNGSCTGVLSCLACSDCVVSLADDGVGAWREGPDLVLATHPLTSPASLLAMATAGLSTNALRKSGWFFSPTFLGGLPSLLGVLVIWGPRVSCGIGSLSFRRGDGWWPSSAARAFSGITVSDAIDMLLLVPIKNYV